MEYDGSEESDNENPPRSPESIYKPSSQSESSGGPEEEEAGDDFDDFEEGAEGEDFGDFDDGDDVPEPPEPPVIENPPVPITVPSFVSNVISSLSLKPFPALPSCLPALARMFD